MGKRGKRRRAVQSSCDEEEDGLDVQEQGTTPEVEDAVLKENKMSMNEPDMGQLRLSDMNTEPTKPPTAPAPGMKWVRVTKTEQTMDEKGYFVSRDYVDWEEVEDVQKPINKPK